MTDRLRTSAAARELDADAGANRRFACPGLFRVVPSRDGGICRIKLPRGRVTAAQLRAIADGAERHGSPVVEATNRANIQIRGVKLGHETALIAELTDAGLGPRTIGADDVRNVMVSPLAGLDPAALIDVAPLADQVLTRLEDNPAYHQLSPKFSIEIDGGETVAMVEHPNDIWFSAVDAKHFAMGFAGCPPIAGARDAAAGVIAAADAETVLFAILDLFLQHVGKTNSTGTVISRMRHLLADMPVDDIVASLPVAIRRDVAGWHRATPMALGHIGSHPRDGNRVALGVVPPLGRLDGAMLRGLADIADTISGGKIRLTPWQSVLVPDVAMAAVSTLQKQLAALGFVIDKSLALAGIVTCAGSIGCASGVADTKTDALLLAAQLDAQPIDVFGVHLTGCSKSCAAPRPAPLTLLGVAAGRYDVFRRTDTERAGFGERIGSDLTIEQAGNLLIQQHSARSTRVPES